MVDYRDEVRLGTQCWHASWRRIARSGTRCAILVANLYDFDPSADAVAYDAMEEVDRYALARYAETAERMLRAYREYDFPAMFQALNGFLTVDLSAFYVDVSKDRLYTLAPASPRRRSAQTAMYRIVDGLTRLIAPILPVTADELWRNLPGRRADSPCTSPRSRTTSRICGIQTCSNAGPASSRCGKRSTPRSKSCGGTRSIGTSLEAAVDVEASGALARLLGAYPLEDLEMLFIVSHVDIRPMQTSAADEGSSVEHRVRVRRASGDKCSRCWRYVALSTDAAQPGLCVRCVEAMSGVMTGAGE